MAFIRLFILFLVVYSALRSLRALWGSVQAPPRGSSGSVRDADFEYQRQRAQRFWEQAQQQYQYHQQAQQQRFYQQQQDSQQRYGQQQASRPNEARQKTPHEVLGVPSTASPQEIKQAYQALVRQYHPDKVTDLGVELRELAEARTKEINAAYNQLKRG